MPSKSMRSKEITKSDLGIHVPSLNEKIGSLLWMDDVILMTTEPKEMQRMLNITDATSGKYHVEFGEPKSNVMKIGGNKEKPEFHLGDMILKYTDKYKYLGFLQNKKNNLEDQIKALIGKVESTYQTILAIGGNKSFKNIEMQTIWELVQSCIVSVINYSSEVWSPTKTENDKTNKIMDNIIKRILMVPQSTPREALYIETGLLDPETERIKNRILMEHRLKQGTSERLKKIFANSQESTWTTETHRLRNTLGIPDEDLVGEKPTVKYKVNKAVNKWFKEKMENGGREKSKVQHLLEGRGEWTPRRRPTYMNKLTRSQTSTIFKARTRMLPTKNNYRNMYKNNTCRACEAEIETQQHVLEECAVLHLVGDNKVYPNEIFNEAAITLKDVSTRIEIITNRLENFPNNKISNKITEDRTMAGNQSGQ